MQEKDWPRPARAEAAPVKDENKQAGPKPDPKPPMPNVSAEFMTWLRGVMIPEIVPFSTMGPNEALKQVAFGNGMLWLKAVIYQAHAENQKRTAGERMTVVAPSSAQQE